MIELLEGQHDEIERLLDRIPRVMGSIREQAFLELRRLLAVHEAIEQRFVHPRADAEQVGSPQRRVHEEEDAAGLLTTLEALDIESTEFETKFRGLREAILAHAESEELTEFARLRGAFDANDVARTHAAVEQVAADVSAMQIPFAEMAGRARTALGGAD